MMAVNIDFSLANYIGTYPRTEIVKAKKQIYEDLHMQTAESLLEIVCKRKCGVLTQGID